MEYKLESTSVWKFPIRGNWAIHSGEYRGNWSPHIPKNIILRYSNKFDTVLDMFVGSGTTLIESKLLSRKSIGIDINPNALHIVENKMNFNANTSVSYSLFQGEACNLEMIEDACIDLICTHPPYADIIKYSDGIHKDLSLLDYNSFL